jgi:CheY-like chemotaxis protein
MKHKWILVVEDDQHDANFTLRAIAHEQSAFGVRTITLHDGSEALDCLHHRGHFQFREAADSAVANPALVLLDLKMPKVDGKEVLRQIKTDPRLKTIPVVVFTSSREPVDLTDCYQMGANAYVVKPMEFGEFMDTVERLCVFWVYINEPPPGWSKSQPTARKAATEIFKGRSPEAIPRHRL